MKQRYRTLDAMRGFAAVAVVAYHAQGLYDPAGAGCAATGTCNVRFGYLAVDMFFALSGFVLAHSYNDAFRAGLTFWKFMFRRTQRLYPLYWLGAGLGALPLLLDAWTAGPTFSMVKVLAFNGLLLPSPTFASHPDPFPLVSPAWSLFFELFVANTLFALTATRLTGVRLAAFLAVSFIGVGAAICYYGTIDVGALCTNFAGGVPRVLYSFFAGVAVHDLHQRFKVPAVPGWAVILVTIATFLLPIYSGAARLYELACVGIVYPTLIFLGAGAIERRPRLGSLLGDASYALYILHIPLMLLIYRIVPHPADYGWSVAVGYVFASIATAWLVNLHYDPPVRRLLGTVKILRLSQR